MAGFWEKLKQKLRRHDGDSPGPETAIEAFWVWWNDNEARVTGVMGQIFPDDLIEEFGEMVNGIDAGLAWEFGPGRAAEHALALSGEGDPALRVLAERWRAQGPGDGPVFEFHATRQPVPPERLPDMNIRMGGLNVSFADFRLVLDEDDKRTLIHIGLYHPVLADADHDQATQLSFIVLDQVLGEDGVERWLGSVDILSEPPAQAIDLVELSRQVAAFAESSQRSDVWLVGEGEVSGQPVLYVLDTAVKRWDHPLKDTFCEVKVAYKDRGDGLPEDDEKDRIDLLENALFDELGAEAVHIGHRTGAGSRLIFLYVDGDSDAPRRVRTWMQCCIPPGSLETVRDPGWERRPMPF